MNNGVFIRFLAYHLQKQNISIQKGTGVSAVGDIVNCSWGRSEIEFYYVPNGSVKNFVALIKNGSFLVRIIDMTILIEKEFIYGSSKRPNPTDYYRK